MEQVSTPNGDIWSDFFNRTYFKVELVIGPSIPEPMDEERGELSHCHGSVCYHWVKLRRRDGSLTDWLIMIHDLDRWNMNDGSVISHSTNDIGVIGPTVKKSPPYLETL